MNTRTLILLVLMYTCCLIMPSSSTNLMYKNTMMPLNLRRCLKRQRLDSALKWIKVNNIHQNNEKTRVLYMYIYEKERVHIFLTVPCSLWLLLSVAATFFLCKPVFNEHNYSKDENIMFSKRTKSLEMNIIILRKNKDK